MRYYMELECPVGMVRIVEEDGFIVSVHTMQEIESMSADIVYQETEVLLSAKKQLEEYFAGIRKDFDLPLKAKGTPFQLLVWEQLKRIPYGETRSYGEIAKAIGNPKASRAVGGANNKNPIGIIVPCHRVIGTNGKLIGYAGGLGMKAKLLNLEKETLAKESKKD